MKMFYLIFGLKFLICFGSQVIGKFSIRIVPDQKPEEIKKLVIDHLEKKHAESGSPNDMK